MSPLDAARLNFDPSSVALLNAILGFVMFGVALDMKVADFKAALSSPKPTLLGVGAQLVLMPALTLLLALLLAPPPSVALGMILVAACPGGKFSYFLTYLAKGNTALSVSMTALATVVSVVTTPLSLSFWGGLHPGARSALRAISVDPAGMYATVFFLLGLPLLTGAFINHRFPGAAARLRKPMKTLSMGVFVLFVLGAFAANFGHFRRFAGVVGGLVLLHNALGFACGYLAAAAGRLPERERRAVALEVGICNPALALSLVFNFFDGLGGTAVLAAWWGIWQLLAGMGLAAFWSRRPA